MEEKSYLYKNPSHSTNLNNLRLDGHFCDVTIKVEDKEIRAHKVVLAANLEGLKSLFLNSYQECKHDIISMENMKGCDVEKIITYTYTGEILLTQSNVLNILQLANDLSADDVEIACVNFLEENLLEKDACRAYKLADTLGYSGLKTLAKVTILSNLEDFSSTTEFLDFDLESLKDILSTAVSEFNESQQILFEATVRWIAHDKKSRKVHIDDICNLIETTELPSDWFAKYTLQNQGYTDIVKDLVSFCRKKPLNKIGQTKNLKQSLIVIQRLKYDYQSCIIQVYDFIEKEWYVLHEEIDVCDDAVIDSDDSCIKDIHAIVFKNKLYYIVRFKNQESYHPPLRIFNPSTKQDTVLPCTDIFISSSALCACNKYIYFCGGSKEDGTCSTLNQILKFDPRSNSFETLPPMKTNRDYTAAVFYQGYLLVLGGCSTFQALNSVEKYDPVTKVWTEFPSMLKNRSNHSVAVLDGKLYACGGHRDRSVEVYDPLNNSWQMVASMHEKRHDFLLVAHEGKLFAMRGKYANTVEVYDPKKNQWQIDYEISSGLQMKCVAGGMIPSSCIIEED